LTEYDRIKLNVINWLLTVYWHGTIIIIQCIFLFGRCWYFRAWAFSYVRTHFERFSRNATRKYYFNTRAQYLWVNRKICVFIKDDFIVSIRLPRIYEYTYIYKTRFYKTAALRVLLRNIIMNEQRLNENRFPRFASDPANQIVFHWLTVCAICERLSHRRR